MDQGNTSTDETNTIILRQCFTFQGYLKWRSWLINLGVV